MVPGGAAPPHRPELPLYDQPQGPGERGNGAARQQQCGGVLQSEGYIRFRADYEASSKSIYEAYKVWCEDNVRKPLSANRLSSELTQNAAVYNVEPTNNIYSGGRRVRGFVGIEVVARPFG